MKIFGIEFGNKTEVVQDQIPEVKAVVPNKIKPAKIPRIPDPVLKYNTQRTIGRGSFQAAEYNLAEIGRIEDTDSYVAEAFGKKSALMFKEGWDLVGKNPRTIRYVKERFAQISRASGMPTNELFRTLGNSLVRKSNAFVIKRRKTEASGGRERTLPGSNTTLKPVAAYFPAPAETMEYALSNKRISQWRQIMPDGHMGNDQKYHPRDVIHMYYRKKDGFVFGTPTLIPVIDDIRALRKIEENIELLVYQHLFPLFQYKVGTENEPAGVDETGRREIDVVRTEIQYMPTEGGIVTPHRHEITAIGAEGRAIRAEGYLDHFKKRVFSGLGVSAVDMGEGETANRATADNMSRNLVDAVKDFQQQMENFINEHIVTELLLESTFGDDVLDEENIVRMKFKEIDIDAQIKRETHAADQFNKDIITWDEARMRMGHEPIPMPTPDEVQAGTDNAEQYPEWHKTRWKLFELPKLLIQSIDEPYSPLAQSIARDNSLPTTSSDVEEAGRMQTEREKELERERTAGKIEVEKNRPKTVSPATKKDGFIHETYLETKSSILELVASTGTLDHDWVASLIRTQLTTTVDRLVAAQIVSFRRGYIRHGDQFNPNFLKAVASARSKFDSRANRFITKLANNVVSSLKRNTKDIDNINEVIAKTRAVFDSAEFRTKFIEDVELRKAETFGEAVAQKLLGKKQLQTIGDTDACDNCQSFSKKIVDLGLLTIDDVPPHHAGCKCNIQFDPGIDSVKINDNTEGLGGTKTTTMEQPVEGDIKEGEFAACPECGKTAVRTKNTPDMFNCKACGHSFQKITEKNAETEDAHKRKKQSKRAAHLKCMQRTKSRLRARHPDWDEDEIENQAEASCEHHLE